MIEIVAAGVTLTQEPSPYSEVQTETPPSLPKLPLAYFPVRRLAVTPATAPYDGLSVEGSLQSSADGSEAKVLFASQNGAKWQFNLVSNSKEPLSVSLRSNDRPAGLIEVLQPRYEKGRVHFSPAFVTAVSSLNLFNTPLPDSMSADGTWHWRSDESRGSPGGEFAGAMHLSAKRLPYPPLESFDDLTINLNYRGVLLPNGSLDGLSIRNGKLAFVDLARDQHTMKFSGAADVSKSPYGQLTVDHEESSFGAFLTLNCGSTCADGELLYSMNPTRFPAWPLRLPFAPENEAKLEKGDLSVSGNIGWTSDGRHQQILDVRLNDVYATYEGFTLEALSGDLRLLPIGAHSSSLKARAINIGVDVGNLVTDLTLSGSTTVPLVNFQRLEGEFLGGRFTFSPFTVGKLPFVMPLSLKDISLRKVLELHKQQYIYAEGTLSAEIPIEITKDGPRVTNATFESGDGSIRYLGDFGKDDARLDFVHRALRDYRFTTVKGAVSYEPQGKLKVETHFEGQSPALNTSRPVNVNLTVEEDLKELLRSLQIAREVEDELSGLR